MASNRDVAYQADQVGTVTEAIVAAMPEAVVTPNAPVAPKAATDAVTSPEATTNAVVASKGDSGAPSKAAPETPPTRRNPSTPRIASTPRTARTTPARRATGPETVPAASRKLTGTHADTYVRINIAIDPVAATALRVASWATTDKRDVSGLVRIAADRLIAKFAAASKAERAALVAEIRSAPRPAEAKASLANYRLDPVQVHEIGLIAAKEGLTSSALLRRAIADVLADEE